MGYYIGATSEKERERVKQECDCILATTSMISVGTDIPTARALVFATPLAHIKQVSGRIRRLCDKVKDPIIYDLVDIEHPETRGWAMVRNVIIVLKGSELSVLGGNNGKYRSIRIS
jgi:superfamily II DNA or RNA helicase